MRRRIVSQRRIECIAPVSDARASQPDRQVHSESQRHALPRTPADRARLCGQLGVATGVERCRPTIEAHRSRAMSTRTGLWTICIGVGCVSTRSRQRSKTPRRAASLHWKAATRLEVMHSAAMPVRRRLRLRLSTPARAFEPTAPIRAYPQFGPLADRVEVSLLARLWTTSAALAPGHAQIGGSIACIAFARARHKPATRHARQQTLWTTLDPAHTKTAASAAAVSGSTWRRAFGGEASQRVDKLRMPAASAADKA